MKGIKPLSGLAKATPGKDPLRTPEKQRAPLSFRNMQDENQDQDPDSPLQYRNLFSHRNMGNDHSQDHADEDESSVSISDEEVEDDQAEEQDPKQRCNTASETKPERWKVLYAQKEKYNQKMEQLRKEKQAQDENPEFSFKPKLISTSSNVPGAVNALPVHERNRLWKEKQQAKLKETSQKEHNKDLSDCTFKPHVNSAAKRTRGSEKQTLQENKAMAQFVKRQVLARQTKEEKETILANPLSKRDVKATMSKASHMMASAEKNTQISSLKKTTELTSPRTKSQTPTKKRPTSNQDVSFSNEQCKTEEAPIHISDVTYFDAIKMLREELHRIPLNLD